MNLLVYLKFLESKTLWWATNVQLSCHNESSDYEQLIGKSEPNFWVKNDMFNGHHS